MKHKKSSIRLPKIFQIFGINEDQNQEKIVCIYKPPSSSGKLLLPSHFKMLMLQLTNKTLLDKDFILQKLSPTDNYYCFSAKFALPEISISLQPLSSKYLINGKYTNQDLEKSNSEPLIYENELQSLSETIVKYICKYHRSIVSCELEWFCDSDGFYLTDISNPAFGLALEGEKIERSVSTNMSRRFPSRPITAKSEGKRFRIPSIDVSSKLNLSRISRGKLSYTTPKPFKLSYEFPSKKVQTESQACCDDLQALNEVKNELARYIEQKNALKKKLEETNKNNQENIEKINRYWQGKCLEISKIMAEKIFKERQKYDKKQ